jgi:hypothetical protein
MFWNICKHHLFASFASYSLQNIHTNLHTKIRFDAEQICTCWSKYRFRSNIRFTFSHTGKYLLQNIRFETNNHKTLSKFHIQANICLQIFAMYYFNYIYFTSKYSLWSKINKMFAYKSFCFCSFLMGNPPICFHAKQANKPVLFASKRINICFTFSYIIIINDLS